MYKNPLKSVNISDNNSLKNQRDYGKIVKKYEKVKLETEPNELQKYYQYLTYQQPILDELNYVAERMRAEDIKTKTDDYNFIEDLKIKREGLMKKNSNNENQIGMETLFDKSSEIKNDDETPVIDTQLEMVNDLKPQSLEIQEYKNELIAQVKSEMFGDDEFNMSIADTLPIKEEKFELSREGDKEAEREAKKAERNRKKKEGRKQKKKSQI
jgi:hypothetical protein